MSCNGDRLAPTNISHELRTPLTLVLGPIRKMMRAGNLTEEQQHDLAIIERNARTLLKNVNDLLDLSKLDAGRMRAEYAQVDLARLARYVASHFESVADQKQIRFEVQTPDALPGQVDAEKLQRILFNLLANAFKFSPERGSVRFSMKAESDRSAFIVQDNGPGVPPEMRERIFERFQQADTSSTRRHGGTGLGLAIVKEFVNLHRGSVRVEDTPGGGAVFTIEVPLHAPDGIEVKAAEPAADEQLAQGALAELRTQVGLPTHHEAVAANAPLVLVVEDNPEMNAFVAETLGDRYRVATAFDGEEGLRKAVKLRPDLIVSDIMMPRMSGEDLVREARQRRELDDVPILLLTAKADEQLRVDLLKSGAQDCLIKPFVAEEVMARAAGLIARKRKTEASLRESYAALEKAKEAAEEANRAKDHFLAVLSHELRTPLTPVLAAMSFLESRADLPEELQEEISSIRRNVELEARLIDDLLDLTRISRGSIELRQEIVDAHAALCSALEMFQNEIEAKDLEVSMRLSARAHRIWADPARIQQVFWNLISNAVKFTPNGGRISVSSGNQGDQLRVQITDTGAGIEPEKLPTIFREFEQGQRLLVRGRGGLGLGLTIAKRLVELHQGSLTATSEGSGRGSTFAVELTTVMAAQPAAPAPSPAEPVGKSLRILHGGRIEVHSEGRDKGALFRVRLPVAAEMLVPRVGRQPPQIRQRTARRLHILLVEDHGDTARIMKRLLEAEGHEVRTAGDIATALELAESEDLDLIISDLGLPDGSGHDLMRQLRQRHGTMPGIALSGYGQEEDIRRSKEAGFAAHLTKPTSPERLAGAISVIMGQVSTPPMAQEHNS